MGMSVPKPVVELVERFERDRNVFLSPDSKEGQLRLGTGILPPVMVAGAPEPTLSHESTKHTKLMGAEWLRPFHPTSCLRGHRSRNQCEEPVLTE